MNLEELKQWMKTHKCVDTSEFRYDESGNLEEGKIFEADGKLYEVEFMNGHPLSEYRKPGNYTPREVKRVEVVITHYESV